MKIRKLFDSRQNINRSIEKVITYGADQEQHLRAEITEYVVTDSIEEQTEKLLEKMQAAMEAGGQSEMGVWVSGFYGSGKSSFTKYLGLALDDGVIIDDQPFLKHLQDRMYKPQTRSLLSTVAQRYPAAVVLLDLATEQVAGATLETVSTVLYYKVLQWAGYSQNLKVSAFERKLQRDGRYQEFEQLFEETTSEPWANYQNDPLVGSSVLPELAHKMYPDFFRTAQSFTTEESEVVVLQNKRVEEIIEIVQQKSGKEYVLFIIDEIGQYVGSNQDKILDLQGLAENLKNIGHGKVWIMGTAQQTLAEDDPRAALNSPELYKLKDRFPIQVNLESSDIKEICYRRLLGKSPAGENELNELFNNHGQGLRHNTKLQDARYYDADFNQESFVHLYPFLPAHFEILLHLLGALAKSTGGIGLRSAIKVVQEILTEGPEGEIAAIDQDAGWLATTVTLYDALDKDIQRAFPPIHQAVGKALIRFPEVGIHQEVAKTVAVLQILGNLPVVMSNIASLIHPKVDAPSLADEVKSAIDDLLNDPLVPLGEKDGSLRFHSERLNDIEQERAELLPLVVNSRRIFNDTLREIFNPPPSTRLHGSLTITSGLKSQAGTMAISLAGDREPVQTIVEFVDAVDYDTTRSRLVDESRHNSSKNFIFLLGRNSPETIDLLAEIYRSHRIVELHRNDPDQEVREYCNSQTDRAARLITELQQHISRSLSQGSFLFRGQTTAVDSLAQDVLQACKKHLSDVAEQVYNRYSEAPERAETNLAEKFLRTSNLAAITAELDPLSLVQIIGGNPSIRTDHNALMRIYDYIDRTGGAEGRRLLEYFGGAPFGWSPDTLRYLIAAMLIAGTVKLTVAGREVTVNGQQAIDALRTNNSFKPIGVALRHDRVSDDILVIASQRLTDLIGDNVIPLEPDICEACAKHLTKVQPQLGGLAEKLKALELPGAGRVGELNQQIGDLLFTDASDAPHQLGAEESLLYDGLKWAQQVRVALGNGLETTIKALRQQQESITDLPGIGRPGKLRVESMDDLELLTIRLGNEDFFTHAAEFNTTLTRLKSRVAKTANEMIETQKQLLQEAEQDLKRVAEWIELTQEEQSNALAQFANISLTVNADLAGLKELVRQEFEIHSTVRDLKRQIVQQGHERQRQRVLAQKTKDKQKGRSKAARSLNVHTPIISTSQIEELIGKLNTLKSEMSYYDEFELTVETSNKSQDKDPSQS